MFSRAAGLSRAAAHRRLSPPQVYHHQCRAASSIWDRVQPSLWHPIATLEQSILEMDRMTSGMLSAPFRFTQSMLPRMHHMDDDDFFKDFMSPPSQQEQPSHEDKRSGKKQHDKKKEGEQNQPEQSYSSYSYSSSTIFDSDGHHITSMRRRYEDSMGRLKAVHEREIDGKKLKTVWQRKGKDDKGKHKVVTSSTTAEEFEEEWKATPFGAAEGQQKPKLAAPGTDEAKPAGVRQTERESEHTSPGPDYEAAERAPDKEQTELAEGVTNEAHDKSREQAIAEGSKKQEEETTPPSHSQAA